MNHAQTGTGSPKTAFHRKERPYLIHSFLLLGIGCVFAFIGYRMLLFEGSPEIHADVFSFEGTGEFPVNMFGGLVLAVGILIVLAGMYFASWQTETRITEKMVYFKQKTLLGTRRWSEPLSNYMGVTETQRFYKRKGHSRFSSTIELAHRDRSRALRLDGTSSFGRSRKRSEELARQLKVDVVERAGEAPVVRKYTDLDKTVKSSLMDGSISIENDGIESVPKGIKLERAAGDTILKYTLKCSAYYEYAYIINPLILAGLIWWGFFTDAAVIFPRMILGVLGVMLGLQLAGIQYYQYTIRMNPRRLTLRRMNSAFRKHFDMQRIESIFVRRFKHGQLGLVVSAGATSEIFGLGFRKDVLEYTRNQILQVMKS